MNTDFLAAMVLVAIVIRKMATKIESKFANFVNYFIILKKLKVRKCPAKSLSIL